MKRTGALAAFLLAGYCAGGWGFYAHRLINYQAVFLLPPEMLKWYKPNIGFLRDHAVDPDKRRYAVAEEGPRHYIDIDHYGIYPFAGLPRRWGEAVETFGEDSLLAHGIGPWWIQTMLFRLTRAFTTRNKMAVLRLSAEIGHYIADAHVPLHASSNHNGQKTGQQGIHGFWESRIPELLAETEWDLFIGQARYISDPLDFTWQRVLESAAASDTVLNMEARLSAQTPANRKYAFEDRNGQLQRQYARSYSLAYDRALRGMVERRMRASILAVASFWYTAWVNAGQPDLGPGGTDSIPEADRRAYDRLNAAWQAGRIKGRDCN